MWVVGVVAWSAVWEARARFMGMWTGGFCGIRQEGFAPIRQRPGRGRRVLEADGFVGVLGEFGDSVCDGFVDEGGEEVHEAGAVCVRDEGAADSLVVVKGSELAAGAGPGEAGGDIQGGELDGWRGELCG